MRHSSAHVLLHRMLLLVFVGTMIAGCRSPYHADQGALTGGLLGTTLGATIGAQSGNTAEGAIVGAAVGALTGGAIGNEMDKEEARNRALIESHLGYAVAPGAVQLSEVISMSSAGVSQQQIIMHVRANGMAAPLTSDDLITLKQAGVADEVVLAMQEPPRVAELPPGVAPGGGPVVIEEHHHHHGPRRPNYGHFYHRPHYAPPRWSVGVGYGN